jgi:DNA-directed RNA polymerase sigma subunit (sigma70/sigma32)
MTLDEIGRKLRLTRERVRQIQKAALAKLQERFTKEGNEV